MAGIVLPQLAPASEDRVSGATVIDGSLRFDDSKKHYLKQTIGNGTSGFTISCWMKPCQTGNRDEIFDTVASTGFYLYRHTDGSIRINTNSSALFTSNGLYRDTTAFYNIVFSYDSTSGYGSLYVNGRLDKTTEFSTQLYAGTAKISSEASNDPANYYLGQWYLIDGQALGPAYFGYTDPLTNTWRPKKFRAEGTTVNDGTRWRTYLSASNGSFHASPYGADAAFNGTVGSGSGGYCQAANGTANPNSITFDVSAIGGIPFKNSVEVWLINNANTVSVNGGPAQSLAGTTFVTVARGPGVLNTIKFERPSTNGASLGTIRVDGVNLRDDLTQNLAFGSEGFYLPLDGNSPIGEDKSGNANDWTPVNFGGSTDITKATGAKPILNTTAGVIPRPGVFGSEAGAYYHTTSASNSGGKYVFEDQGTQPTFSFIRGATYVFDWSASTDHPIRFATAADAAGSTEYTDGTDVTGNVTTITVPHNAPDTLYYYCNVHNGMGNSISVTTDETKADPYAWKNVLALPLTGSVDDVSASITCTSTKKTIANNGTIGVTTSSNFYNGSTFFDGVNDQINVTASGELDLGEDDDWTFELWFNSTTVGSSWAISDYNNNDSGTGNPGGQIYFSSSSGAGLHWYQGSSRLAEIPKEEIQANNWHHVAFVKDGTANTITSFLDGIQKTSSSFDGSSGSTSNGLNIGQQGGGSWFKGYMSDFRVYKGIKKYTSNFIPASSNPDILPDSPSGVSVKSKLTKITDGSVSFDGTDYLTVADGSNDFAFGTGAYTVEGYLYPTTLTGNGDANPRFFCMGTPDDSGNKNQLQIVLTSTGQIRLDTNGTTYTSTAGDVVVNRWQHIAVARDGSGNLKSFVNGKQVFSQGSVNNDIDNNDGISLGIEAGSSSRFTGYMSNVRIIKGTALYTSNFTPPAAPLTNVTNTKLLCCQSTTSATAAVVTPGTITVNGDAAATMFNPFNTNINTVRGQEGGYCTWNPLFPSYATTSFSNGNLDTSIRYTNGSNTPYAVGTVAVSSGKWFWEITLTQESNDTEYIGFIDGSKTSGNWVFADIGAYFSDARKAISTSPSSYGTSYTTGDVIGVALDADNGNITFYKNGVSQGAAATGMTGFNSYRPFTSANGTSIAQLVSANFGQKPYKYPVPDGFQPLTSSILRPDTIIARPDKFCNTVLYRGTGSDLDLDVGFQPDLSYFSCRSATGYIKYIFDSVRGPTKTLATSGSQGDDAQGTASDTLKSFNSNGVTIGNNGQMNENDSNTWASWHWKAGGAPTATNDNTSGAMDANSVSIDGVLQSAYTPSGSPSIYPKKMSIGTKQGFSIIQWTDPNNAQTLPHGLSQAPDFILIKDLGAEVNWSVYHSSMGNAKAMYLNNADDEFSTSRWNSTSPTANVFSWNDNTSTNDQIAYCWHNVPGLQKFGKYIGSGSDDGSYVELGFKPAMLWVKCSSTDNQEWVLWDNKRSPHNLVDTVLYHHTNTSESDNGTTRKVDFLNNGFKLRNGGSGATGIEDRTYLYMAWAEAPAYSLFGAQSNAR